MKWAGPTELNHQEIQARAAFQDYEGGRSQDSTGWTGLPGREVELDAACPVSSQAEDLRLQGRSWREDVVRRSEDVVSIWEEILMDTQADLGDERWMILEQV